MTIAVLVLMGATLGCSSSDASSECDRLTKQVEEIEDEVASLGEQQSFEDVLRGHELGTERTRLLRDMAEAGCDET